MKKLIFCLSMILINTSSVLSFGQSINQFLKAKLDTIYIEDQQGRLEIEKIEKQFGSNSREMEAQWKIIQQKDSVNLIHIKGILDQYGWLGEDVVGERGNTTLFLVIQHADHQTQLHYLPMMRTAVKQGKAKARHLALLEDRTALGEGKKQIYGSQIGTNPVTKLPYVLPLKDPDHVDERRAAMGLQSISEYIALWKIKWDIEQYKKDLQAVEAQEGKKYQ